MSIRFTLQIAVAAAVGATILGSVPAQTTTLRLLPAKSAAERGARAPATDKEEERFVRVRRLPTERGRERVPVRRVLRSGPAPEADRKGGRGAGREGGRRSGGQGERGGVVILPRRAGDRPARGRGAADVEVRDDAVYVIRRDGAAPDTRSGRSGRTGQSGRTGRTGRQGAGRAAARPQPQPPRRMLTLDRGPAEGGRSAPRALPRTGAPSRTGSPRDAQLRELQSELRELRSMLRRLENRLDRQGR